jgi:hypothetical protein
MFSECQGRAILSVRKENLTHVETYLAEQGVSVNRLGTVCGQSIRINGIEFGNVESWRAIYQQALTTILEQ